MRDASGSTSHVKQEVAVLSPRCLMHLPMIYSTCHIHNFHQAALLCGCVGMEKELSRLLTTVWILHTASAGLQLFRCLDGHSDCER